ncbi:MAG: enoyl-CoA hydratase/isomerase family protein [Myxococcota bacterium]|jgi:enoyl-CoA hydratase/carnithine racemase
MSEYGTFDAIGVQRKDFVATVEIQRGPHNYFDQAMIGEIADAFDALDGDPACRAIVLASEGKSFCAGARLGGGGNRSESRTNTGNGGAGGQGSSSETAFRRDSGGLYREAIRLFRARKPVVAAVHGAAIGGGLGLALMADFRVTCPEARFAANFAQLGFHPGFGLSVTLPELVGRSHAMRLALTGRRIKGEEALEIGLADRLVALDDVRATAIEMASEIASSAPLAVESIRATLRRGLADRVHEILEHELTEQERLIQTQDAKEGIRATAERRPPVFTRN